MLVVKMKDGGVEQTFLEQTCFHCKISRMHFFGGGGGEGAARRGAYIFIGTRVKHRGNTNIFD